MPAPLGLSFLESDPNPGGLGRRKRPVAGALVDVINLNLPSVLGQNALAPSNLLSSTGGSGPTGLSPVSPVGRDTAPPPVASPMSALTRAVVQNAVASLQRPAPAGSQITFPQAVRPTPQPPAPAVPAPAPAAQPLAAPISPPTPAPAARTRRSSVRTEEPPRRRTPPPLPRSTRAVQPPAPALRNIINYLQKQRMGEMDGFL